MAPPKGKPAAKKPKPEKFKPPAVSCDSLTEVDDLLALWCALDAIEEQAKLDKKIATQKATDEFKEKLFEDFPSLGGRVPFADRRIQFEQAIRAFCEKHREHLLQDGLKSRRLNYGEFGWEKSRDALGTYAGVPKDGNEAVLEELQRHLEKTILACKGFSSELLGCLKIDVRWSRDLLMDALQKERISRDDLRQIGFKFEPGGQDEFFCRPLKATGASVESAGA